MVSLVPTLNVRLFYLYLRVVVDTTNRSVRFCSTGRRQGESRLAVAASFSRSQG